MEDIKKDIDIEDAKISEDIKEEKNSNKKNSKKILLAC